MKSKYKHIFEPFTVKHMTIKNRIVMTPMGTNYGKQSAILNAVREEFEDQNVEIMNIGDSVRARRIIEGTEEARNILNVLAKHDYL